MAGELTKKVTIYVNGKQVDNTLKSLNKELIKARNELRNMTIGSEEYVKQTKKIEQLNTMIQQHSRELKGVGKDWKDLVHTLGSLGNIASGIRSVGYIIQGTAQSVVDATETFRNLDDIYGKVRKTTGMTREEVERLNESFKKMDTRTSREQLNELAYQAGKLGITGVENVAQFVRASDQINIALGDVLGDNAMITVGKLAGVYEKVTKELEGQDLETKMVRMGDAVNQLGKSSTANEQYIIDFTARLAGVASQAGLSADQVMGFASALDQDMQRVEMSATAFQKLIVQVYRKPEQFAKMAGKSVKEFSEIVKNDMNGALQLIFKNMNSAGGMEELVPFLDDVQLAGQRATTIFSDLANNINKVTEAQAIAKQQLEEGGSMLFEYTKMNETAEAQMEKMKKTIVDAKEALGKELMPVAIELVNLGGKGVNTITALIQVTKKYWPVLASVASYYSVIAARLVVVNALEAKNNMLQKVALIRANLRRAAIYRQIAARNAEAASTIAQTRATEAHTRAVQAEKAAMASTPWGAIIAGAALAVTSIYRLIGARKEHIKAINDELKAIQFMDRQELEANLFKAENDLEAMKQKRQGKISASEYAKKRGNNVAASHYSNQAGRINEEIGELTAQIVLMKGQLEIAKKNEAELNKLAEGNGSGGGYTPEDKKKGWASIVKRVNKFVQSAKTGELDGLAKSIEEVADAYEELKTAINGGDGSDTEKKDLLKKAEDAMKLMKENKTAEYLKKVNDEVNSFAKKMRAAGENEFANKLEDAANNLAANILTIDNAIERYDEDVKSITDPAKAKQMKDYIDRLKEMRNMMVEAGISRDISKMEVKQQHVAQHGRKGIGAGVDLINQRYADSVAEAERSYAADMDVYRAQKAAIQGSAGAGSKEAIAKLKEINEQEELAAKNLETLKQKAEETKKVEIWDYWLDGVKSVSDELFEIANNIATFFANREQEELNAAQTKHDNEVDLIQDQYDKGIISQEQYNAKKEALDEAYQKKYDDIKIKQWKREKLINISQATMDGILAVMKTFAKFGYTPVGLSMAALQGATTATQIAALAATPKPYAKGGYANEKTIMVGEAGPEWVASNKLLSDSSTAPMIAALDAYQKGNRSPLQRLAMQPAWGSVSYGSARAAGSNGSIIEATLLRLERYLSDPNNRRAVISRKYMDQYTKDESFLRNAAAL